MKSTREIFKNNPSLLDEPEVAQLLEYCKQLQDEIIEFKFKKKQKQRIGDARYAQRSHQRLQRYRERTSRT